MVSVRERIRCGLLGGTPDRVPLHCRRRMVPSREEQDRVRELGWGVIEFHPTFERYLHGCAVTSSDVDYHDRRGRVEAIDTPAGRLTSLAVEYHHGSWFTIEHLFKAPADYEPLLAMVKAIRYRPAYGGYHEVVEHLGEEGYCWSWTGYDPMHEIVLQMMGVEAFSYQWADHRSELLGLYDALAERHREMYRIVAAGPAEFVTYGGNIQPHVVGRQRFEKYYLPCYQEFGDLLHAAGKRFGAHLDDKTRSLADLIARAPWDVLEAFGVAPDGDVSVAEARELWPGRVISLNFPSALHLASGGEIKRAACQIIAEAGSTQGLLISLTEDFPRECAEKIFVNIAAAVAEMN